MIPFIPLRFVLRRPATIQPLLKVQLIDVGYIGDDRGAVTFRAEVEDIAYDWLRVAFAEHAKLELTSYVNGALHSKAIVQMRACRVA